MSKENWGNEEEPEIVLNQAQCALCKDIITSKHRHDFVWCKCGSVAVDGGRDYLKRCGEPSNIKELSKYKDVSSS